MNKVILIGRLGRDPETKWTGNGLACCAFSMATDESYKDRSGEKQKRTEWHRIVLWGKPGENAGKMLKKGSLVSIEGKIQSREYEKNGQKQTVHEIIATAFFALDAKPAAAQTNGRPNSAVPKAQIPKGQPAAADSEYPF